MLQISETICKRGICISCLQVNAKSHIDKLNIDKMDEDEHDTSNTQTVLIPLGFYTIYTICPPLPALPRHSFVEAPDASSGHVAYCSQVAG